MLSIEHYFSNGLGFAYRDDPIDTVSQAAVVQAELVLAVLISVHSAINVVT